MRNNLPGAAKYVRRLTTPQPCSVTNCGERLGREDKQNGPAHYHTASGLSFCMSHRQRYLLVELAQRLFRDGYMTCVEAVKPLALREWIALATSGDDEAVNQRLEAHKDDCARWKIDESIL